MCVQYDKSVTIFCYETTQIQLNDELLEHRCIHYISAKEMAQIRVLSN